MNEPVVCWLLVAICAVYRQLLRGRSVRKHIDDAERYVLSKLSSIAPIRKWFGLDEAFYSPLFEWYSGALLLLGLFLCKTFFDICVHDYMAFNFLKSPRVTENIHRAWFNGTAMMTPEQERDSIDLPQWLKGLAMLAPMVGVIAFCIVALHVIVFASDCKEQRLAENQRQARADDEVKVGRRVRLKNNVEGGGEEGEVIHFDPGHYLQYKVLITGKQSGDWFKEEDIEFIHVEPLTSNPWRVDDQEDLALLVIITPAVFIVMAMRAHIRVIQVMTCSSISPHETFNEYNLLYMGTYSSDLECAAVFQYLVVLAFGLLCTRAFNLEQLTKNLKYREEELKIQCGSLKHRLSKYEQVVDMDNTSRNKLHVDLANAGKEHTNSLILAGMQGVWAYIAVGLVRSFAAIVFAITQQQKRTVQLSVIWQNSVLDKVQPVFMFATVMVIYNMFVICQMYDIKEAFGKKVSLKFLAARVLLLLADGQDGFFKTLSKLTNNGITFHQGKLCHVSLLMIECLGLVIFNAIMWRQVLPPQKNSYLGGAASSAIEPRQPVPLFSFSLSASVSEGRRRLARLKHPAVLHASLLPSWLLLTVLLMTSLNGGGPSPAPAALKSTFVDQVVKSAVGPLVPFILVAVRAWLLPTASFAPRGHGIQNRVLPADWYYTTLVVWIFLYVLRILFFLMFHSLNYYFSDHIFLIVCILWQLQMELAFMHIGGGRGPRPWMAWFFGFVTWVIIIALLVEVYVTSTYFHTIQAVWTAWFVATLLFGGISHFFIMHFVTIEGGDDSSNVEDTEYGGLHQPLVDPTASSSSAEKSSK
eukprot:TRINITY_DN61063_c0_g1_i1.p1 TRINITY_DN61063_c0_g1~~TRINITY_DN61063_c0_g1_i1.p1  ORF type:complete len:811 (-),score=140.59 TRINITY_DN61063_c0_g1_i1:52-2484(-)